MTFLRGVLVLPLVALGGTSQARNFVVNGDFSAGNTGFKSNYTYVAPSTDSLYPEGNFTLARDTKSPNVLNTNGITDYKDHTSSDGLFFLVNGARNRNSLVWEQTLEGLAPGRTYQFTLWLSRWTPNQSIAAKLAVSVDGAELDAFEDPNVSGVWVRHRIAFMATSASPVLQIRNREDALYGNDFALDDLSVEPYSEPNKSPTYRWNPTTGWRIG